MWHYFHFYFERKQIKKTIAFFVEKQGLTPLEKYDFWDFQTVSFNNQKGSFLSTKSVNTISSFV